jgi:hypothetical protein
MADDISNSVILEHIHAMKSELQSQINGVKIDLQDLRVEMRQGFKVARRHRQALQEDLDASIRMLGKHAAKLARL